MLERLRRLGIAYKVEVRLDVQRWRQACISLQSFHFFMFCWPCVLIIFVMKTIHMHYLSLIYIINQPLHVSGMFIVRHQEVFTVYVQQLVRVERLRWLAVGWVSLELFHLDPYTTYQLLYIYSEYLLWWVINMPETCRGWLTKWIKVKLCIWLVAVRKTFHCPILVPVPETLRLKV
jgi:hypothetical protein